MLTAPRRVPWWHWVLLSLGSTLLIAAVSLAGLVALAFRGVDFLDYMYLAHPPYLRDGATALLVLGLVGVQTIGPVFMLLLYRPGRALMCKGLCSSEDSGGMLLRLVAGAAATVLLQVGWSRVAIPASEQWRVADHLIYAVVGGGQFWPLLWLVITVGLVVPLAEELLFRGFIFGGLRRRWGFMGAALASAIIFGLPHGPAGAVPAMALGFFLAYQVEQDGVLTGAIALHALNNLGALVAIVATM